MNPGLQMIQKDICSKIEDELDKVGILYRLFSRIKDERSIFEKIERKKYEGDPYYKGGKLIQDILGIRIVTYFKDDIELVKEILDGKVVFVDEEIDEHELTVFKPKRTNIICAFDENQKKNFKEVAKSSAKDYYELIDNTYELQLRTILSEGWHEIDHSLRYKCKTDWLDHPQDERMLNGIYANLEINDSVLKNLFEELAYKHYVNRNWEALIRNKFRLRFHMGSLLPEIAQAMQSDTDLCKYLIKVNRSKILTSLSLAEMSFPITVNNLIFFINTFFTRNKEILEITPTMFIKEYETVEEKS
ncbi:hypothetical protein AMR72_17980 [Flavobacterium psychrophilum]|nr:hypothetical protein AMR72_17980 [Flavobacterium psychrophilum]AOE54222.1 hypothetical protein ALW18_17965 [Flavobacterium psychrophilum]